MPEKFQQTAQTQLWQCYVGCIVQQAKWLFQCLVLTFRRPQDMARHKCFRTGRSWQLIDSVCLVAEGYHLLVVLYPGPGMCKYMWVYICLFVCLYSCLRMINVSSLWINSKILIVNITEKYLEQWSYHVL